MNASPKGNPTQGSSEEGKALDFAKAKARAHIIETGKETTADVLAPLVMKAKGLSMIESRDEQLRALEADPEANKEFLDAIRKGVDPTMFESMTNKLKFLMPFGAFKLTYENFRTGAYAGLILLGAIGTKEQQDYLASQLETGTIQKYALKGLALFAKFDPDPDTQALIQIILKAAEAKDITLDTLGRVRERVRVYEVNGGQLDLKKTLRNIEDAANLAQLPVEGDHLTPEEMAKEAALGPETKKDAA